MKSTNIEASIIIPARNALATLGQTIQSVLTEISLNNAELIVVNDGMDDDTDKIANNYPVIIVGYFIRIIIHPNIYNN